VSELQAADNALAQLMSKHTFDREDLTVMEVVQHGSVTTELPTLRRWRVVLENLVTGDVAEREQLAFQESYAKLDAIDAMILAWSVKDESIAVVDIDEVIEESANG
jgi:hypothetical protein